MDKVYARVTFIANKFLLQYLEVMIVERMKKALEIEKDADRDFKNLCECVGSMHVY